MKIPKTNSAQTPFKPQPAPPGPDNNAQNTQSGDKTMDLGNLPHAFYNKISFCGVNKDKNPENKHFQSNYIACLFFGGGQSAML